MSGRSRNEEQLEDFYKNQFSKLALEKYKGVLSYRNLKKITRKSYTVLDSFDTVLITDVFKVAVPILLSTVILFSIGELQEGFNSHAGNIIGDLGNPSVDAKALDSAIAQSLPFMSWLVIIACIVSCIVTVLGMLKNLLRGVYYFYESPERVYLSCSYREYRSSEFLRRYLKLGTEEARREFLNSDEGKALLFMLIRYG